MEQHTFKVTINGGPIQDVAINSGLYILAVYVAIATLKYDSQIDSVGYDVVKIWSADPNIVVDYGPYLYAWTGSKAYGYMPSSPLNSGGPVLFDIGT